MLWAAFANFTGMSLVSLTASFSSYREYIVVGVFTHTLFLSVKIIELYDMKSQIVNITIAVLGAYLLYAFVYFFRGFDFVASLSNIFQKSDRYRYAYGFRHVNTAGRLCLFFFVFVMMYRAILSERKLSHKIRRATGWKKFAVLFPAVLMILLSTASRTSLSALILFCLVYWSLNIYQRAGFHVKAMMITFTVWIVFMLAVTIDWLAIWNYFWESRGMNYIGLFPLLVNKGVLATGVGMLSRGAINEVTNMPYMDSYYLSILLKTGLVGFTLFFATVFCFIVMYFRNIKGMTELQKLAGALIVLILYYGIFEGGVFYGHNALDLINWILLISCMNEKYRVSGTITKGS